MLTETYFPVKLFQRLLLPGSVDWLWEVRLLFYLPLPLPLVFSFSG